MSTFIIPMAGLSSRFFNSGFNVPKYQLPIENESMFAWSLSSFKRYFSKDYFLFIVRDIYDTPSFVHTECLRMGIESFHICVLDRETKGQAETVALGLKELPESFDPDILIFNIDSQRKDYLKPDWINQYDGYLELFIAEGDHWSFAKLDISNIVTSTAEKRRISQYASNGLYYFSNTSLFNEAYKDSLENNKLEAGELYVAPLYNYLIQKGYKIKGQIIDEEVTQVAGTPEEYRKLVSGGKL